MKHLWGILLLVAITTSSIAAGQCHAQSTPAADQTVAAATPTPTITFTPTVIPSPSSTLCPTADKLTLDAYPALHVEIAGQVVEVTQVSAQQALQLLQWQKQNDDAWWRFWLSMFGFSGAIIALMFAGWRATSHYNQVREQMLTSFRERLFSKDPGAVIAAAMSLSVYPKEAIWLVMRWAEEHTRGKLEGIFYKDPHQIKQAINDAMSNMSCRYTWIWKKWDWPRLSEFLGAFFRFVTRKDHNESFEIFFEEWLAYLIRIPCRVCGARLDGKTISIDIGPINLYLSYMVDSNFKGIGLGDAKLLGANLQYAHLFSANLQHVDLSGGNLQHANLLFANLQNADLWYANLQDADLSYANLNGVYMLFAKLQDAILDNDYLSYAQNMSAILDDEQKQKAMEWEIDNPDAPWLKAIPCWWVYEFFDKDKMHQLQSKWAKEMGGYIKKTREAKNV